MTDWEKFAADPLGYGKREVPYCKCPLGCPEYFELVKKMLAKQAEVIALQNQIAEHMLEPH